jgi:hypothetical protein
MNALDVASPTVTQTNENMPKCIRIKKSPAVSCNTVASTGLKGNGKTIFVLAYYRPLGFQEVGCSHISRQLAHEGRTFVSPTHWPPLTPGNILVLISVTA